MSASPTLTPGFDGALLIDKPVGMSSFGVIEALQRKVTRPGTPRSSRVKMGHGGTLDPFATGLLIVCCGKAVKLARYFLGSRKEYEGIIRFGETTIPGDPTAEISERSEKIPASREEIQAVATALTKQAYLQTPPMHSAKKKNGRPLYELAREGIEVDREPKLCELYAFEIPSYTAPRAEFSVQCSSGTYIRTLAQDMARSMGSVALLETLRRRASGNFRLDTAMGLDDIEKRLDKPGTVPADLTCWVPFDRLLDGFARAEATDEEARSLYYGQQGVLFSILKKTKPSPRPSGDADSVAIYHADHLIAVAKREAEVWGLERVFPAGE